MACDLAAAKRLANAARRDLKAAGFVSSRTSPTGDGWMIETIPSGVLVGIQQYVVWVRARTSASREIATMRLQRYVDVLDRSFETKNINPITVEVRFKQVQS